jgi:hypothetical protein
MPAAAKRVAMAFPIPRFAPVTMATLAGEFEEDEAVIPLLNTCRDGRARPAQTAEWGAFIIPYGLTLRI